MSSTRQESFAHRIRKRVESLSLVHDFGPEKRVVFRHEGNQSLLLPHTPFFRRFANNGLEVWRKQQFFQRPNHEVVLRTVVHHLYEKGAVSRHRSIIDIGSWIGDNALVWAKTLEKPAVVHAVDPSAENIEFAQSVASLNCISNIKWYEAVCADSNNQAVGYVGNLDHASFFVTNADNAGLRTRTLDAVIGPESVGTIGLMHVDVEGFELAVLRGSHKILSESRPIILFEGHLREQDVVVETLDYLQERGYQTFMLNEVLPGCNLDCRNFLSAPEPRVSEITDALEGLRSPIDSAFPAALGPPLLSVVPSR